MDDSGTPLLSITQTRDGVWSVNERGPTRIAIAHFPNKWGALRHAVRVARARRRCRVALVDRARGTLLSDDHSQDKT